MKKLFTIVVCLALLLTACAGDPTTSDNNKSTEKQVTTEVKKETEASSTEQAPKGYYLRYKDVNIPINVEAAPVIAKLPKENAYFEAASCAFQGLDKIYTYNGFELHTYEVEGVDHVHSIIFLDDTIATTEGVRLFSKIQDVTAAYGDGYKESMGLYTYEKDGMSLAFLLENDEVVSIEYSVIIEE